MVLSCYDAVIVGGSKACRVVPLSRSSTWGDLTLTLSLPELSHIFGGLSSVWTAKRDVMLRCESQRLVV